MTNTAKSLCPVRNSEEWKSLVHESQYAQGGALCSRAQSLDSSETEAPAHTSCTFAHTGSTGGLTFVSPPKLSFQRSSPPLFLILHSQLKGGDERNTRKLLPKRCSIGIMRIIEKDSKKGNASYAPLRDPLEEFMYDLERWTMMTSQAGMESLLIVL